jgi:hypothetical protein
MRSKKNDGVKNLNATIFLTGSLQGRKQTGRGGRMIFKVMKERKFILVIPSWEIGTDDETLDS